MNKTSTDQNIDDPKALRMYAGYEHIDEFTKSQAQLCSDIFHGNITHDRAREMTRVINATISEHRNQLEYAALSGNLDIAFYEPRTSKTIEVLPEPITKAVTKGASAKLSV